ncbi:MAG: hypothetical protein U1F42_00895 [Candidatus Competibacteraceae bacterium]
MNGDDVATGISGTRLNGSVQGLMMAQKLLHAQQLIMQMLRSGVEIPLTFSINSQTAQSRSD